jgi:hypothetical protein
MRRRSFALIAPIKTATHLIALTHARRHERRHKPWVAPPNGGASESASQRNAEVSMSLASHASFARLAHVARSGAPFALLLLAMCGGSNASTGSSNSGSTGSTGGTGTSGTSGSTGKTGATGSTGSTGATGGSGASGTATTGTTGASGTTGSATGGAGASGTTGASGTASGTSGASGTSTGASGASGTSSGASGSGDDGGLLGQSILQFHAHANRDGFYIDSHLMKSTLQGATLKLDSTFDGTGISGEVRAQPLFVANDLGGGTFYVVTEANNVYAFDAMTGKQATKMVNLGTGLTKEPCGSTHQVGIRGTPAIDLATGTMVLDSATGSGGTLSKHTIYGLSLTDLSTKWSIDASMLSDSTAGSFSPTDENQRGAVLINNGIAYVTYGGYYGDCGTYHGWVIGVPLATPTVAATKVYATPATESGIWAVGGPSTDGTNVYVATGNGGQVSGKWGGAFSLLRFTDGPTFSGQTSDYWLAVNDSGDEDLGGSGPLMVNVGSSELVVQLGKDGYGYLLDRTKSLGGSSSPLGNGKLMDDEITTGPASAVIGSKAYIAMLGNNAGSGGHGCPNSTSGQMVVATLDPSNATTPIATTWCGDPMGAGSPIITTSDGTNDSLVWVIGTMERNDGSGGSNQLHAWDLETGSMVVMGSDTLSKVHHFQSPIVVNGRIFVVGDTQLYALTP